MVKEEEKEEETVRKKDHSKTKNLTHRTSFHYFLTVTVH